MSHLRNSIYDYIYICPLFAPLVIPSTNSLLKALGCEDLKVKWDHCCVFASFPTALEDMVGCLLKFPIPNPPLKTMTESKQGKPILIRDTQTPWKTCWKNGVGLVSDDKSQLQSDLEVSFSPKSHSHNSWFFSVFVRQYNLRSIDRNPFSIICEVTFKDPNWF